MTKAAVYIAQILASAHLIAQLQKREMQFQELEISLCMM